MRSPNVEYTRELYAAILRDGNDTHFRKYYAVCFVDV